MAALLEAYGHSLLPESKRSAAALQKQLGQFIGLAPYYVRMFCYRIHIR